jgi:DNA invertase Pin-like site-specific DNA recombinase
MVTRLDRLARSTRDLLEIRERIAKAGLGFRSTSEIADLARGLEQTAPCLEPVSF